MRPTVGLMPTTELKLAGHIIDPLVSVPSDTATIFAATDIDDPLLEPQGFPNVLGFCTPSQKHSPCFVEIIHVSRYIIHLLK